MSEKRMTPMQDLADFFKAMVRPFTIAVFIPLIAIMTYEGRFGEIPLVVLIAGGLVTGEYSLERILKRGKEIKKE